MVYWGRFCRILLPALLVFAVVPAAQAAWWWPFGYKGIDYEVRFEGVDKDTLQWLHTLKLDERNKTHPPQNAEELQIEAAALGSQLRLALEAHGYYDVTFTTQVEPPAGKKGLIAYAVHPGDRYKLRAITVQWEEGAKLAYTAPALPLKIGDPVDADTILANVPPLEDAIGKENCLLSLTVKPRLTLYRNHTADLAYVVSHGAVANFGAMHVSGTTDMQPKVVQREVKWQRGECYRQQKIDDTRTALLGTRLFSSVDIRHAQEPDANGEVPMTIHVAERAPRTLSAGVSYGTDDTGLAVTAGWEHRNILGGGQDFATNATLSQNKQELKNTLTFPHFLANTKLVLTGNLKHEDLDSYSDTTLETAASLQRALGHHLTGGAGVGYTLTHSDDALAGASDYALLSFPTFLTFDNRDNVLDSRRGFYINLNETPYTETFGDGGQFLKSQLTVQTYLSAPLPLSPTLALKGSIGSIAGSSGEDVPTDIRFFAGGGNSVRGYGYQTLGPRANGSAIGGASVFTASSEVRTWFTPTLGAVAFLDAGNAYAESTPQFDQKLYYGAGVGLRYATPIGPLRLDVGIPLNGHDIGAAGYALYISVGQAF